MDEERLLSYHRFTREHGVNRPLYFLARLILVPFFLVYFRLARIGREHGKVKGPLIVVANHRSFLDPFVIAICLPWRRPNHFVAKAELFEVPLLGRFIRAVNASADSATLPRSAFQTRPISCRMSTNPGRPHRDSGGK